ncbi:MAG TPA: methyltransferase domain-containing protein, partial [bacterium]|nr:methyltransferase domain-containing protein [bacterium]
PDARQADRLIRLAQERNLNVQVLSSDLEREPIGLPLRHVTNVVCLDVLETLRDDVGVLEKLHRILEPEGKLVVRVRAHSSVKKARARAFADPLRAYDAETLRESLEEAAFRPLSIRHWNFLGVPGTFLHKRILHRGFTNEETDSQEPRHWWDRGIDFWFRAVENRFGFPVGVSLIAVATPYFEKASVKSPLPGKGFARRAAREAYEPMAAER